MDKYNSKPDYLEKHNGGIDVRLNGAYVVIGLLYGEGDLDQTIIISTRCGNDSDCNPSSAAGVLFTSIGRKNLPERFTTALNNERKFSHTPYDFPGLSDACLKLAKIVIEREGGNVVGDDATGHFVLPQKPVNMMPYVSAARPEPIANSRFTAEEIAGIVIQEAQLKRQFAEFFPGWEIDKSADVPACKKTTLKLTVASLPEIGGPWQLMVRVDMADLFDQTIDGEKKLAWKELEIELSEFAGKTIELELYNNPDSDWTKSYAAWKSMEIVSE